jgi:acetyltransferase-like isoleucine patch superfamily enzyme
MINIIPKFIGYLQKAFFLIFYKRNFCYFGEKSTFVFPFKVGGSKNIEIFSNVHISEGAWLLSYDLLNCQSRIKIKRGSYIGRYFHLVAVNEIEIGENVLIADKVYISDNVHGYEDIASPIIRQKIISKGNVRIGDDSWIGENVCIIGASVGKHSVIGANSVVTRNIPDFCVAVGAPAKVIKKFNFNTNKWECIH